MQTKNRKKYIFQFFLVLSGLLVHCIADAQNSRMALHKPARNLIWPEKIEMEVSFLSDTICAGRGAGTRGGVEAAAWIARKFDKAGLMKFGDTWSKTAISSNGTACHNVIGFLPGNSKDHRNSYIIIGAHFDHLGTIGEKFYPGADANASGVVALTSLAEMLSMTRSIGKTYGSNIIFVGFDGYEMDMAGSYGLWNMITEGKLIDPVSGKAITRSQIGLMINIDQIGSTLAPLNDGREDYLIMLDGKSGRSSYRDMLNSCNSMYEIGLDLGFSYYGSENFTKLFYRLSDQRVFVDNRIPAVMFTSGITMNNNKTWDKASTLNMEILHKRINLIYHWTIMML